MTVKLTKIKTLLILGVERSGTSLLASLLGAHSEINMLDGSYTIDTFKLTGKPWRGNKLNIYRNIWPTRRSSRFGFLVNRIINFNKQPQFRRWFSISALSVEDYVKKGAKLIFIFRKAEPTIQSMIRREGRSRKSAEAMYRKGTAALLSIARFRPESRAVFYENIVQDPEGELIRLCKFLDLEFEPRMLEGCKFNWRYQRASIMQSYLIRAR